MAAVREIPKDIVQLFKKIESAKPVSQERQTGKADKAVVSKADGYSKSDNKFRKSFGVSGAVGGARFAGSAKAILERGGLKGTSKAQRAASVLDKLDRAGKGALLALATRTAYEGVKDKLGFSTTGDE